MRAQPGLVALFPPGPEIQDYFQRVTEKYGIDRFIRFKEEAVPAEFRDGRWHLDFASGLEDSADLVITATGVLRVPKYPDIPGIDDFQGALFHSARRDHSVPLDGARSLPRPGGTGSGHGFRALQ